MLYDVVKEKRDLILKVAGQHGIQNVSVFGKASSFVDKPTGELNLLVEFEKGRSLFDLIRFKQEIEELLRIRVNVLTEKSIHWSIKTDILNEAVQL